jgi:Zn-dependent protease
MVTAAGPFANLAAAALAYTFRDHWTSLWVYEFAWMSGVCGLLNLLPVLHFDGKRLLVQWLSHRKVPHSQRGAIVANVDTATVMALLAVGAVLLVRWFALRH